ncbi:DegV family protein [Mycobacterium colombiense]|uniref:Fatty acid-binding protein DegV n=1 Tax=Mycobacterium colombiense TaxID=339268 RepID=A0A1A2Z7R4_9MYCO|nr:DegV family protein [Mycobacterium colombiense]OBI45161.1 hypothetical protein A5708_15165 [Mycobacterium colombiense]
MADVAVVTDSTGYLPRALVDKFEITVVSQYYDVGGGPLRELDFDGDFARFYAALDPSKTVATTSPPSVQDFAVVFERLLQQRSAVVAVLISSGVSDTCSVARQAAAQLESGDHRGARVTVIDSAGFGGHLGLQALVAARAAAGGADPEGVIERVRQARNEIKGWALVDSLEYLRRSNRVGAVAAWVGSALDLKPILTIESELKAVERVRTRRRGIDRLVELMRQHRAAGADRWFLQQAYAHDDAKQLAERLAELLGTEPEFISEVGPVVATHVGPGTLVVGGLPGAALR